MGFINGITLPPKNPTPTQVIEGNISSDTELDEDKCGKMTREEFFAYYGVTNFDDSNDDLLGTWFCTECYLDPLEKPPDFESCRCCLENYYFPFPPHLPKVWICPGCKRLQNGEFPVTRQCNLCGKGEVIITRIPHGCN